VNESTKTIGNR